MSSSHEPKNGGASRLEWSADDDDDFFSEDGKQGSDGGWDDGFDVDVDVDVDVSADADDDDDADINVDDDADKGVIDEELDDKPDRNEADDSKNDGTETPDLLGDTAMEAQGQRECIDGNKSSRAATDSSTKDSPLSDPVLSGGLLPPLGRNVDQCKPETSPKGVLEDSSDPKVPKSAKKLSSVSDSSDSGTGVIFLPGGDDDNFEEIVRKRNQVRKEKEDYHIAHIKVQMGRLEDALAAETKRRVDATTALDDLARTQVHEMEERVRGQLREENEKLQTRLCALEERVRALEEKWAVESDNQIELVKNKAADLSKSISQIRDDQDMERKSRLKREGIILQQVEEHAKEAEERWASENKDRVQRLKELEDQIIRNEARLALEQKRYEDRIEQEMISLKEELELEAVERQTQDEEIVAALNRYTQQLQHSLSILSSD